MSEEPDYPKIIAETVGEIVRATETYNSAKQDESFARNNTTSCLNRLNQYQREFDKLFKEFTAKAPSESDWKRDESR